MTNLAINSFLLVFFAGVSLADNYYSYQDSSTDLPLSADCSVNGTDIFSIPEGDALIINTTIYDNIKEITRMTLSFGRDVTYLVVDPPNRYVTLATSWYTLSVKPIDETIEISQPSHTFYYNFTLSVTCDGIDYPVESLIPIHETNTYTPVFSNEIYEYSLFSTFNEDLQRLIELNPIVANDNDISNTEVIFSIKDNEYFDLQYGGVIAGSLNKNHSARLIPKKSELDIAQNMEFVIYVTDLGYPPRSSNASIILKPLRIKSPTF
ncbi:uncharacterized protein LOC108908880 [Anoplophora glabripennis]|uniref:uncharacterized protein LOC108908880 n=1 Tax=Anoplophora glabripennis TaxID=217634 RepID=UPI000873EDE5|nr:uncharacterized protein LOC108908880 [Anoplophora glabripennis]